EAGKRPRHVAKQLYDLVTDTPPSHSDSDLDALRDAAFALRKVPSEVAHRGRWSLIAQTARDMAEALDAGDLALLQDLTVDLELLNEIRANSDRIPAPPDVRVHIDALLDRIDRRITVYTA
ncbi:MAG: CATRA system-associated protein, partial [Actinomycetes bacterium]